MFGSFMMLASGLVASSPKAANASGILWSSFRYSGKFAKMRPDNEISGTSISISADFVKA